MTKLPLTLAISHYEHISELVTGRVPVEGVDLTSIHWIQAGAAQPGRLEKVRLKLPPGIKYEPRPDKSLGEMLISGEIDAALSAHPPLCFDQGHPNVARLFPDYLDIEMKYVKDTGIYPIMHVIVFKREIVERNPWVA